MDRLRSTVLIVDDDSLMVLACSAILRRGGYCPITATDPLEALQKSRDFTGTIDLLMTDVMMVKMDGPSLAQEIIKQRPGIRVLLMSGANHVRLQLPLLKKPFDNNELLAMVANVIAGPAPADLLPRYEPSLAATHGSSRRGVGQLHGFIAGNAESYEGCTVRHGPTRGCNADSPFSRHPKTWVC